MSTSANAIRQSLTTTEALEARVDALEFLMLGVLRGIGNNCPCKRSMLEMWRLMFEVFEDPELDLKRAYKRECKLSFAERLLLAWGDSELRTNK